MGQTEMTEAPLGTSLGVLRVVATDDDAFPDGADDAPTDDVPVSALLGGNSVHCIRQVVTTIGRGLHNTVILLDPTVSREHARIICERGEWLVENVSAQNPIWVGEHEVPPRNHLAVASGDRLRLGHTTLQLLAPRPVETPTPTGDSQSSSSSINLLDPGVTIRFALAGRLTRRGRLAVAIVGALLFLASALVTLGTAALVGANALATLGAGAVLAAITIPLVPALGAALLVGAIDRYEREPIVVLVAAFAWGALIAIPAALFAEHALNTWLLATQGGNLTALGAPAMVAHSALQGLSAGLTEECVKGAGLLVLLIALRDEFDNVTDGIIYGVLIGAGFAMVENFVYFAGSPRGDLGFLILGRVVLGWLGHSTFTAIFGVGLGYARETRDRRRRLLAPLLGFGAAVLLHSIFDFVDFQANASVHAPHASPTIAALALAAVLADYLPLFAAQAVLLRILFRALRREAAIVREYLAPEVSAGVVTPDEYAILQRSSQRVRLERDYLLIWGPRAYLTARALHQTAIGLAFRKWHVAMGDQPKATPRQPEDVYRERIARLRRALSRLAHESVPVPASASTET